MLFSTRRNWYFVENTSVNAQDPCPSSTWLACPNPQTHCFTRPAFSLFRCRIENDGKGLGFQRAAFHHEDTSRKASQSCSHLHTCIGMRCPQICAKYHPMLVYVCVHVCMRGACVRARACVCVFVCLCVLVALSPTNICFLSRGR